jgi:hypothetical protein
MRRLRRMGPAVPVAVALAAAAGAALASLPRAEPGLPPWLALAVVAGRALTLLPSAPRAAAALVSALAEAFWMALASWLPAGLVLPPYLEQAAAVGRALTVLPSAPPAAALALSPAVAHRVALAAVCRTALAMATGMMLAASFMMAQAVAVGLALAGAAGVALATTLGLALARAVAAAIAVALAVAPAGVVGAVLAVTLGLAPARSVAAAMAVALAVALPAVVRAAPLRARPPQALGVVLAVVLSTLPGFAAGPAAPAAPPAAVTPPAAAAPPAEPPAPPASGSSTDRNPTVLFPTPGDKQITLTVCNAFGQCSALTQTLAVLDPRPAITSLAVTPPRLEQGQTLLLDGEATGQPPLSYNWRLLRNGTVAATLAGAHAAWPATIANPPGTYTAELTAANAHGSAVATADVTLLPRTATRFFTVSPCRALDTRATGQPLAAPGPPRPIAIAGLCGVPPEARAVAANLTVVAPTAAGWLAVYPADQARPTLQSIPLRAGLTRATFAVLPLATDGTARLAAAAALDHPGSLDLVVDVAGYFASPAGAPPAALEFQARLCPFGFCDFAAGTEIFFAQSFAGAIAEYRYDWTGSGVFAKRSPVPIKSHLYPNAVGVVTPTVQVAAGGQLATLAQPAPMVITASTPPDLPPAPQGLAAVFIGYVTASPIDPTIAGPHPAYQLAVASPSQPLLGYNVYASRNHGAFRLIAALDPALPANEPLVVDDFTPPIESLRIAVSAVSFAGEGPRSAPLALGHP